MRSRTSRGVPEWSGGKDLYMGSPVLVTGKVSGDIGNVPGPPGGFRGSTGRGHPSRGATWAAWGREPAPGGLGAPPTAHATVLDVVEHFPDLRTPPESSGIFWKLPGTIPKNPELFPEPEQQLSIYKSLPPDHSGTPRDVRDLIRDSEQHSATTYKLPL